MPCLKAKLNIVRHCPFPLHESWQWYPHVTGYINVIHCSKLHIVPSGTTVVQLISRWRIYQQSKPNLPASYSDCLHNPAVEPLARAKWCTVNSRGVGSAYSQIQLSLKIQIQFFRWKFKVGQWKSCESVHFILSRMFFISDQDIFYLWWCAQAKNVVIRLLLYWLVS